MTFEEPLPPTAAIAVPVVQQVIIRRNGFAVAALVLGIVGIVVGIVPLFIGLFLSFVPTVLAITFGVVGLVKASRTQVGFAAALTGLILGGVTFLLWFTGYGLIW